MITSMTAFGRTEESRDWGTAIWEVRTVNHRYLETSMRLPEELRMLEPAVRERIARHIKRGKVDCCLRLELQEQLSGNLPVNQELAGRVIKAAASLPLDQGAPINPIDVLRWPGVVEKTSPNLDDLGDDLLSLLESTLSLVLDTRRREGEKIHHMLMERCEAVTAIVDHLRQLLPGMLTAIRDRYLSRAREQHAELDQDRLEGEMLLLAQKMDVAEELDRLDAHIGEVRRVLGQDQPVGRRLDFLMQEMNREANTIGSKSFSSEASNASVELKVLIEQMREQIQNIE